jgi:GAF domain-containing protein
MSELKGPEMRMIGPETLQGRSLDRLFELILRLSSRLDQPTLPEDILLSVASLWSTGVGGLLLTEPEGRHRLAAAVGIPSETQHLLEGELGAALLARVKGTSTPVVLHERHQDAALAHLVQLLRVGEHSCQVLIPMLAPSGAFVGALILYLGGQPTEGSLRDLPLLAPLLAQYIVTARAYSQAKQTANRFRSRATRMQAVAKACKAFADAADEAGVLRRAVSCATMWIPAQGCAVDLWDGAGETRLTDAACRTPEHGCGGSCSVPSPSIRRQLWTQAERTRSPIVLRQANAPQLEIAAAIEDPERWEFRGGTTLLFIPLESLHGLVGAVTIVRQGPSEDEDGEDLLLSLEIARHVGLALDTLTLRPDHA